MNRAEHLLLILILSITAVAAAVLAVDSRPSADEMRRSEEFQRLVGGLGFGPALDLGRCESAFDPRLCPECSNDYGPIAGGMVFCPYHASAVVDYPALP